MMQCEWMQQAKAVEAEVIAWRRQIHANPETAHKECNTADFIEEKLREFGYSPRRVGETGLVAALEGGKGPGKTIGLRADIDALPIQENTGLSFASQKPGVMHACGHDAHTSILLGVAKILAKSKKDLPGRVKFFFQPAEETLSGAILFVNAGELDDLDAVAGLHVFPDLDTGAIGIRKGPFMAAVDTLEIVVTGRSSHGAYPHLGIDAIVMASHSITALQTIVSRNVSPLDSVVLSFGAINGGAVPNIIADKVILQGTLRTLRAETRAMVIKRMREILGNVAAAFGGEVSLNIIEGIPSLLCADEWVDRLEQSALRCIPRESIRTMPGPVMGGEDFSLMLEKVPGVFFRLGSKGKGKEACVFHSPTFMLDEGALVYGVGILSTLATDFLLGK